MMSPVEALICLMIYKVCGIITAPKTMSPPAARMCIINKVCDITTTLEIMSSRAAVICNIINKVLDIAHSP